MTIVVDAMGGDHAPGEIVKGALLAADEFSRDIVLVGRSEELAELVGDQPRVRIEHAPEVIGMDEHPAQALKKKRRNSITIGMQLAAANPGSAFVSAGSTGAVMAGALFTWKRLPGVERPALAGLIPCCGDGWCVMVDMGANVDCKPGQLAQFAVLGAAYARHLKDVETPRVGLLNIGSEATKGNEQVRAAHGPLGEVDGVEFLGNVEPADVFRGAADVVVADGFAGNIFLKSVEATAGLFGSILKQAVESGGSLPPSVLQGFRRFDPANSDYAGAPLLGVNGTAIIVHGSARAETLRNAVGLASRAADSGCLDQLRSIYSGQEQ